jgi:hypothetical protein
MSNQLLHGAGCKVIIGGVTRGFATGITWTRSTATKFIYEIDNPYPVEIIDTTYSVSGTMSGLRLMDNGNLENGIVDLGNTKSIFSRNYVTVQVVEIKTGQVICNIKNVIFDNDSWNIAPKQLIGFNVQFKGMFVSSERG